MSDKNNPHRVNLTFRERAEPEILISDRDIKRLMTFKEAEQKGDPDRLQGLHGPYEEMILLRTGKLPTDYYEVGNNEPWGLRIEESRSNILWQVTSGMMDNFPEFGAAYMALALDQGLDTNTYATEINKLHKDWGKYIEHAGLLRDHRHQSMGHIYRSVACPACSVLTAIACRDSGMITLFKNMTGLNPAERREFLREKGLLPYLNMMIPEREPKPL